MREIGNVNEDVKEIRNVNERDTVRKSRNMNEKKDVGEIGNVNEKEDVRTIRNMNGRGIVRDISKIRRKAAAILLLVSLLGLNTGILPEVNASAQSTEAPSGQNAESAVAHIAQDMAEAEVQPDSRELAGAAAQLEGEEQSRAEVQSDSREPAGAAAQLEGEGQSGAEVWFDGWVQDDAGLLTSDEEDALEAECGRLFQIHGTGVYIVTTPNFGGGDIKDWQRQVFSQYGLGADSAGSGVMLAISMAERDWGLVGFGSAQEAFSTYARERLGSLILDDLSDGEFYEAFSGYLSIADDYLSAAEEGKPYTEQHRYREGWRFPVIFGVSFLLSLGVSAAVVIVWRKGMNTRVRQEGAMEYLKAGSFHLSNQSDLFLYHTVSRTKRPENNSSGGSGSMHSDSSGTSGKF